MRLSLVALILIVGSLLLLTRPRTRLAILAFLAVPQVFVPGLPLSLFEGLALFFLVAAAFDRRLRMPRAGITLPIATLALLSLVYALFSPDVNAGVVTGIRYLALLGVLVYAWSLREDDRALNIAFAATVPWIVIQAVLTVAFITNPAAEDAFLRSPLADVLVGGSARALFTGFENNVLDPAKAGGLFVNANVASMFLGVAAFALVLFAKRTRSRMLGLLGAGVGASVVATGSKTGVALLVTLPVLVWFMSRLASGMRRLLILPIALLAIVVSVEVPNWISAIAPAYATASFDSLGSRGILWDAAAHEFARSPLLGLGFGGFQEISVTLTGTPFPPHNYLIAAWATTGLLGAIAALALTLFAAGIGVRRVLTTQDAPERRMYAVALGGILWIFIHGMGDNTAVFGEARSLIFFAILLTILATPVRRSVATGSDRLEDAANFSERAASVESSPDRSRG